MPRRSPADIRETWEDETAIEKQRLEIEAWAQDNGFQIVNYIDNGIDGTLPLEQRPVLHRAIIAIEDGQLAGLVITAPQVDNYERLARGVGPQEEILERIWTAGGRFYTPLEGEIAPDHGNLMRIAYRRDKAHFNAQYSLVCRARRQQGIARKKARQGYLGGLTFHRPYGRELVPNFPTAGRMDYRPIPTEQAQIRRMCQWHTEGVSYGEIARRLNTEGIPTVTGVPWVHKTVRDQIQRGPIGLQPIPRAPKSTRAPSIEATVRAVARRSA